MPVLTNVEIRCPCNARAVPCAETLIKPYSTHGTRLASLRYLEVGICGIPDARTLLCEAPLRPAAHLPRGSARRRATLRRDWISAGLSRLLITVLAMMPSPELRQLRCNSIAHRLASREGSVRCDGNREGEIQYRARSQPTTTRPVNASPLVACASFVRGASAR